MGAKMPERFKSLVMTAEICGPRSLPMKSVMAIGKGWKLPLSSVMAISALAGIRAGKARARPNMTRVNRFSRA